MLTKNVFLEKVMSFLTFWSLKDEKIRKRRTFLKNLVFRFLFLTLWLLLSRGLAGKTLSAWGQDKGKSGSGGRLHLGFP